MKAGRLLASLAVGLWAVALWPGGTGGGATTLLIDVSPSAGGGQGAWKARRRLAAETGAQRVYGFAGPIRDGGLTRILLPDAWPGEDAEPVPAGSTQLGRALRQLRGLLRPGDRLVVATDGRVTDRLPPAAEWAEVEVRWRPLRPPVRLQAIDAPASWPGGRVLEGRALLAGDPGEDAALEATVTSGPALSAFQAWPEAAGVLGWRIRLEREPEGAVALRLRCRTEDGGSELAVWIAPAGQLAWHRPADPLLEEVLRQAGSGLGSPAPGRGIWLLAHGRELGAAAGARLAADLQQGGIALLCGSSAAGWARPFPLGGVLQAAPPEEGEVWFLLDRSGSMDGAPLEAARAGILAWLTALHRSVPVFLVPFAEAPGPVADLRSAAGRSTLEELTGFGPTDLGGTLAGFAPRLPGKAVLVIVSDGRSAAPAGGWQALKARLPDRVVCVPVGADADAAALGLLGEVAMDAGGLEARVAGALERGLRVPGGPGRPAARLPWTLPDPSPPLPPHPRFEAAPGAEVLLRDGSGGAVCAVRRLGRGAVVGLAAEPGAEWIRALGPLLAELLESPRLRRTADGVEFTGDAEGWTAAQGVRRVPFDPVAERQWKAGGLGPGPVTVESPAGDGFELPGWEAGEFLASRGPWMRWLAAVAAARPRAPLRRPFLAAGLFCAVAALWAGHRNRRGR